MRSVIFFLILSIVGPINHLIVNQQKGNQSNQNFFLLHCSGKWTKCIFEALNWSWNYETFIIVSTVQEENFICLSVSPLIFSCIKYSERDNWEKEKEGKEKMAREMRGKWKLEQRLRMEERKMNEGTGTYLKLYTTSQNLLCQWKQKLWRAQIETDSQLY